MDLLSRIERGQIAPWDDEQQPKFRNNLTFALGNFIRTDKKPSFMVRDQLKPKQLGNFVSLNLQKNTIISKLQSKKEKENKKMFTEKRQSGSVNTHHNQKSNQTVNLRQLFPSYSLKTMEAKRAFSKPVRISKSTTSKQESAQIIQKDIKQIKLCPEDINLQRKQLDNQGYLRKTSNKKCYQHRNPNNIIKQCSSAQVIQKLYNDRSLVIFNKLSLSKSKKNTQLVQQITDKKKFKIFFTRTKTMTTFNRSQSLRFKAPQFLNLPKIQIIQLFQSN